MADQQIDPKARVWTVTLGKDGRLQAIIDRDRLRNLQSTEQLAA